MDEYWCLGDIVGYGPDPAACLSLVRERCRYVVAGNHDLAAAGEMDLATFNPEAARAVLWTSNQLNEQEKAYLGRLDLMIVSEDFTLVHGSPDEPAWEYILDAYSAKENFARFDTPFCLVGHSHIPVIFCEEQSRVKTIYPVPAEKKLEGERLIINPGSVGQPRDGDWRASFMVYDTLKGMLELRRVGYNVKITQEKMRRADLPSHLIERLSQGR